MDLLQGLLSCDEALCGAGCSGRAGEGGSTYHPDGTAWSEEGRGIGDGWLSQHAPGHGGGFGYGAWDTDETWFLYGWGDGGGDAFRELHEADHELDEGTCPWRLARSLALDADRAQLPDGLDPREGASQRQVALDYARAHGLRTLAGTLSG